MNNKLKANLQRKNVLKRTKASEVNGYHGGIGWVFKELRW